MAAKRVRPFEHVGIDLRKPDPRVVWARSARASSEYSSGYAARAACGRPTIYPEGGDRSQSWLAANDDARPWIELTFPELDRARAILVCETCGAGAVREVVDLDTEAVLYSAAPALLEPSREAHLLVIPVDSDAPVRRLRIDVAPYALGSEYKEIDAVALSSVPFEELATRHVPPPTREEQLARVRGTLVGVSPERPIVHALLHTRSDTRARSSGEGVQLRLDDGALLDVSIERTTVYGGRVVRRSGTWKKLAEELPILTRVFAGSAPEPAAATRVELRLLEGALDVEIAGEIEETRAGGFRDVAVERTLAAAAIARDALSASPFVREGLAGFEAMAPPVTRPKPAPHALRPWSIGLSITTTILVALTCAAFGQGERVLATILTSLASWHLAATLDVLSAQIALPVLVSRDVVDRRPPFGRYLWTYVVLWMATVMGGFAILVPVSLLAAPDAAIWMALSLGGGVALARLGLAWRAHGRTLRALLTAHRRAVGPLTEGAWARLEGQLGDVTIRRTEQYVAKARHLGTDHYTDAQGQRQSHDRFETWYERHIHVRTDGELTLYLSDGRLVRALGAARSTDTTMVPQLRTDYREGDFYACFEGVHEAGDVATFHGVVRQVSPTEIAVEQPLVVLGPRAALWSRWRLHVATLVAQALLALVGAAALLRIVVAVVCGT